MQAYIDSRAAEEAAKKNRKPTRFNESTGAEEIAEAFSSEISGKTILITGVTRGGVGAEAAKVIAIHQPKLLILAGRTVSKIEDTISDIKKGAPNANTRVLKLDLSSKESIRAAATELSTWKVEIDVLINNAAVMLGKYIPYEDGELEMLFGTNHLGPWLFTNLIMGSILAAAENGTAKPRIVNIGSRGHSRLSSPQANIKQRGKAFDKWLAYGQSKTGNHLFSVSLAEKLGDRIISVSVHPGGILTNLIQNLEKDDLIEIGKAVVRSNQDGTDQDTGFLDKDGKTENTNFKFKSVSQGAATHLAAAFDPSIENYNGAYLQDCNVDSEAAAPYALDKEGAEKLWKMSEGFVGQQFSY